MERPTAGPGCIMFGSDTPPAIPDHELLRCIGSGNYGRVWLARNVMGTYRAVKVVQRQNFKLQRPFDREYAGIMKYEPVSRTHPGFVSILHVGINNAQGCFYYMMDLADDVATGQAINPDTYQSRTLASDKERQQRLPVADCLLVGTILASALACLHKHGLVHRDIKPTNIIFVNGTPKFADIGLVTEIGESATFVGSEGYVPPEGPGKPTADIFGLGKVLFEILTGQHQLDYPRLPEDFDQLPDATDRRRILEVIARCCEQNPNKRFQHAREIHEKLEVIQAALRKGGPGTPSTDLVSEDAPQKQVVLIGETRPERFGGFLGLLRNDLARARCQVFIDQPTGVDAEWARQIEQQIARADAIVALLSAESGHSETLAYEISLAQSEAQRSNGRPRLICVNLELGGSIPTEVLELAGTNASVLSSGEAGSPAELSTRIVTALQSVAGYTPTQERPRLEAVGGAVPLDSKLYIKRPADERLDAAITGGESLVLIKGARQMGKTSLLARGLQKARDEGLKVILTDCQKLNATSFESLESFFFGLGTSLADQLDLDVLIEDVWDSRRSPNFNFERYLKREVLGPLTSNLVWGLDEVDRLFPCPFRGEVFGLFRAWHNARALEPNSPWSRLTLAMAYATEVHLFITDHSQSPFNVGTRLELQDFTPDQVAELNRRHGSPLQSPDDLAAFIGLVGGQPYLVRRGLHELATNDAPFAGFLAGSDREEGVFGDHLRRLMMVVAKEPHLLEALRQAARGQPLTDIDLFYRLRSAGLLAGTSLADARLRCDLYRRYFAKAA